MAEETREIRQIGRLEFFFFLRSRIHESTPTEKGSESTNRRPVVKQAHFDAARTASPLSVAFVADWISKLRSRVLTGTFCDESASLMLTLVDSVFVGCFEMMKLGSGVIDLTFTDLAYIVLYCILCVTRELVDAEVGG